MTDTTEGFLPTTPCTPIGPIELKEEVTLESLCDRLDMLGEQMNWLCDNLAGLFGFVNNMQQNGGGIRGAMKMLKDMPEIGTQGDIPNE